MNTLKRSRPAPRVGKPVAVLATVLALGLTGCSDQLGDRGGKEGSPPDLIGDVDYVEVYRNADGFPNVARVCVQGLAFATSSSGRGESSGATPVIRVPEWDGFCAQKLARP
ncbi:hypothetical protein A8924_5218 [Saccharopolyspora erythraea NRRL 2338]|uniref:Lipoprotein n=1 Tax=Saccharopolyspora erythraea TaxID=1836 RepID=A0ABN1E718_SACER|nr:hypothetical protein [Saccharopolyspora erythraea]PFG97768.1 hypothetical protein A8924_5218 [Saccharopolyspora erythraea NRRL 2338]